MRHAEPMKPVSKGALCPRCDMVGKGLNRDRRDGMKNGGQDDSVGVLWCWIIPQVKQPENRSGIQARGGEFQKGEGGQCNHGRQARRGRQTAQATRRGFAHGCHARGRWAVGNRQNCRNASQCGRGARRRKRARLSLEPSVPFAESRVQRLPSPDSNMAPRRAIKDAGSRAAQVSLGEVKKSI